MSTEHSLQITNVMNVGSVQVTTLSHCTKWREEIRRVRDIQSVQCFLLATLIARTPNFPSHELCFCGEDGGAGLRRRQSVEEGERD